VLFSVFFDLFFRWPPLKIFLPMPLLAITYGSKLFKLNAGWQVQCFSMQVVIR